MPHTLSGVFLIISIISNTAYATAEPSVMADCRDIAPEQMIDKSYADKNDWRKWQYRLSTEAVLTKDGHNQKIWLLADIAKNSQAAEGQEPWLYDDGAPWAVVIEAPDGRQTLVYLEWSQFGQVETMVVNNKDDSTVLIINRQATTISIYEVKYQQPGQYSICQIMTRDIQSFAD